MKLELLIFILLVVGVSHAASINNYKILFDVQNDLSIMETINVEFDGPLNFSSIDYSIEGAPRDVSVSDQIGSLNFMVKSGEPYVLTIFLRNDTRTLGIEFNTDALIFAAGDKSLFFTDFSTEFPAKNLNVELKLPESYGALSESIKPSADIRSDGRRISVVWSFNDFSDSTSFAAKFENLNKGFAITPIVFGFLVVIVLIILYYRRRVREHFMKGFSEDEQRVISYISGKVVAYQNVIEKEMKFSRAKMTRITSKLEAKGLIEKKRKGRTNRLTWRK